MTCFGARRGAWLPRRSRRCMAVRFLPWSVAWCWAARDRAVLRRAGRRVGEAGGRTGTGELGRAWRRTRVGGSARCLGGRALRRPLARSWPTVVSNGVQSCACWFGARSARPLCAASGRRGARMRGVFVRRRFNGVCATQGSGARLCWPRCAAASGAWERAPGWLSRLNLCGGRPRRLRRAVCVIVRPWMSCSGSALRGSSCRSDAFLAVLGRPRMHGWLQPGRRVRGRGFLARSLRGARVLILASASRLPLCCVVLSAWAVAVCIVVVVGLRPLLAALRDRRR